MGIHRLSIQLANQIAAGEVVERQSSVVKELLENAVDAGADDIKCYIEGAGRILIRVSDNGSGIPCDELELALAPHATSKISTTEDLENIQTLGFRGEALASIASVTKLTLTSRTRDEQDGYQVSCEGPQMEANVIPAPHGIGTTVEARELFFNTPARRRFLRSDRTELGRIKDVFIRCALSHPEISFELISDNKSLIKVRKATDELSRFKRIAQLSGSEFKDSVSVNTDDPLLQIKGLALAGGDASQGGTEKIFLFLNSRPVADKTVVHAVREAYSEFYGKGQTARCVLYLTCSPHECDVNVHPRKDEVRFHHARDVHDLISQTLLQAFEDNRPKKSQDDLLGLDEEPAVLAHVSTITPAPLDCPDLDDPVTQSTFPSGLGGFFQRRAATSDAGLKSDADVKDAVTAVNKNVGSSALELKQDLLQQRRNADFQSMVASHAKASRVQLEPHKDNEHAVADIVVNAQRHKMKTTTSSAEDEALDKAHAQSKNTQVSAPCLDQIIIERMSDRTVFIRRENRYLLVNLLALKQDRMAREYESNVEHNSVVTHALSIPFALRPQEGLIRALKKSLISAERCGFKLAVSRNQISVLTVPAMIQDVELSSFCSKAFAVIASSDELLKGRCPKTLSTLVVGACAVSLADHEINELLNSIDADDEHNRALCRILDIRKAVATFEEQV